MLEAGGQVLGNQNLDTFQPHHMVSRDIPSAYVGTDRYLSHRAGSIGNAQQVHRSPATLFLDVGYSFFAHGYAHQCTSRPYIGLLEERETKYIKTYDAAGAREMHPSG